MNSIVEHIALTLNERKEDYQDESNYQRKKLHICMNILQCLLRKIENYNFINIRNIFDFEIVSTVSTFNNYYYLS
jgi:hypothetical protein